MYVIDYLKFEFQIVGKLSCFEILKCRLDIHMYVNDDEV